MTYRATVKNGALVLEAPLALPDGSRVEVEVRPAAAAGEDVSADAPVPTLLEQLAGLIGAAPGLPADLAENHDHYLYGREKR
jgi:hypothetical protein